MSHTLRRATMTFVAAGSFILLPVLGHAQSVSVKAGLSYGQIPNNGGVLPGKLSPHSGIAVGVGVATGGVVGFGAEALYAQRGFESTNPGSSQELSYIDVPVYLKLTMPSPSVTPFAYVGPQASFEVKCDANGGTCPSGRAATTYSGIIGAGVKFGAFKNVSIEGRYVYGLTDLKFATVTTTESYKTRSFMLLAGIGF